MEEPEPERMIQLVHPSAFDSIAYQSAYETSVKTHERNNKPKGSTIVDTARVSECGKVSMNRMKKDRKKQNKEMNNWNRINCLLPSNKEVIKDLEDEYRELCALAGAIDPEQLSLEPVEDWLPV